MKSTSNKVREEPKKLFEQLNQAEHLEQKVMATSQREAKAQPNARM